MFLSDITAYLKEQFSLITLVCVSEQEITLCLAQEGV